MSKKPQEKPSRELVANRTIDRLKNFSETLDSKKPLKDVYTCRKIILEVEIEPYTAEKVKEVRELLGVSQPLFASFLNVSLSAVQKWERGGLSDGAACRLMEEIRHNPDYWRSRFLSMARKVNPPQKSAT